MSSAAFVHCSLFGSLAVKPFSKLHSFIFPIVVQQRFTRRTTKPPPWWVKTTVGYTPQQLTSDNDIFLKEYTAAVYKQKVAEVRLAQEGFQPGEWTPGSVRTGVICKKIGVVPQWTKTGDRILAALLQVQNNVVMKYVDPETFYKFSNIGKKEGRMKLGRIIIGVNPGDPQKYTAAYRGLFEQAGIPPTEKIASFAVTPNAALAPGTRLYAQHFKVGQYVDLWAKTIDYGFQGVMRRWNFGGMPATHGTTKSHRRPGSIGTSLLRINVEHQVLYVKAFNVPGPVGNYVYVKDCWIPEKRVESPPFPTFYPQDLEEPLVEQVHESLFSFTEPTIVFPEEVAGKAKALSKVKKQAKVKK